MIEDRIVHVIQTQRQAQQYHEGQREARCARHVLGWATGSCVCRNVQYLFRKKLTPMPPTVPHNQMSELRRWNSGKYLSRAPVIIMPRTSAMPETVRN